MRVLLADDAAAVRERLLTTLSEVLSDIRGVELTAPQPDACEGKQGPCGLPPDAVVLDVRRHPAGNVRAVQIAKSACPDLMVIILADSPRPTGRRDDHDGTSALLPDKASEADRIPSVRKRLSSLIPHLKASRSFCNLGVGHTPGIAGEPQGSPAGCVRRGASSLQQKFRSKHA